MAATLAKAGLQGRTTALEGGLGFLSLYGGPNPRGWDQVLTDLGKRLAIEHAGIIFKRHPCCGSSHFVLDCVLDLKREHRFDADDVIQVDALIGSGNKRNLMYDEPQNEMQARFSLQYCVAVALLNGRLSLTDFTPKAIKRPVVRRLLKLTNVRAYDPVDEPVDPDSRVAHRVEITLKDGRQLRAERAHTRGSIDEPFDEADRVQKFKDCCGSMLVAKDVDALRSLLTRLRDLDSLRSISARLRVEAATDAGERFEHMRQGAGNPSAVARL